MRTGQIQRRLAYCVVAFVAVAPPIAVAVAQAKQEAVSVSIARMDDLWRKRESSEAVRELMEAGTRALESDPRDFETLWRVARAHWWLANTQQNRSFKKALAVKAMELAESAMQVDGTRGEGHYIYAIAIGEYAMCIGISRAVMENVADKVERAMLKAYEIDRDIDDGAPITALGRYYYMLPWPMRDLEKSKRYLEEVKQRHPNVLVARLYLAETYYALGEKDRSRDELEFVVRSQPNGYENAQAKGTAAQRLAEWFA
jgi:hypothetical protein